jgi:hypothetical protein
MGFFTIAPRSQDLTPNNMMKTHTIHSNNRLTNYLTAAVSAGTLASTASAAIVTLDVSSISGINGGASSYYREVSLSSLSPGLGGTLYLMNGFFGLFGLYSRDSPGIATIGSDSDTPRNFSSGSLINASANFEDRSTDTLFRYDDSVSPDFGANSFIGFLSADEQYGYLEVTWTAATNTFQILSGAYESTPGVGIRAGAAAVPEPSTAMLSLGALAAGAFIRRRKQAA